MIPLSILRAGNTMKENADLQRVITDFAFGYVKTRKHPTK